MSEQDGRETPPLSRRAVVTGLAGLAAGSAAGLGLPRAATAGDPPAAPAPAAPAVDSDSLSLAARAQRKGIIFGAAELQTSLYENPEYQAAFLRDCALLAPENELKFYDLRKTSPEFDFRPADWLYKFASSNRLLFSGHVFAWGIALPKWAKDTPPGKKAEAMLVEHIWAVAGRYRGRMHSWDTVNEAIEPNDNRPDLMRDNYWMKALGPSYVELAFRTAAEADPDAILFYNEYGLEYIGDYHDRRREGTLKMLDRLVSAKVPIHAVGLQSHLPSSRGKWMDHKGYTSFLDSVHQLGLRTMITELDVTDHTLPLNIAERDDWIAKITAEYLATTLEHPSISELITWGYCDKYTYLNAYHPRPDGFPQRPLPIDSAYQRKPMWWAIARALDQAPSRPPFLSRAASMATATPAPEAR